VLNFLAFLIPFPDYIHPAFRNITSHEFPVTFSKILLNLRGRRNLSSTVVRIMALRRGKRNLKLQVSDEAPVPVYVKYQRVYHD